MARAVAIGVQYFDDIRKDNCFYIDKTDFIKEWWEDRAKVTLITRPRRFGKTLAMSTVDYFFSVQHADMGSLFEGLSIWEDEKYRNLQGTYPVIFLSFANIKGNNYKTVHESICQLLADTYAGYEFLLDSGVLAEEDRKFFKRITVGMKDSDAVMAVHQLSKYLFKYYGKKVIILLDEYDTPMQEAYVYGYWDEMAGFIRRLFHSTFKTNSYLERGLMTGITRVSKESVFSDLNNLEVVTITSRKYQNYFGFTECEVVDALNEFGLQEQMHEVKKWYDGFKFGDCSSIYNPWSITQFLDKGRFMNYWANTSSNNLVSSLIQKNSMNLKIIMEDLLQGKTFDAFIDEEIVFDQLDRDESAVWSLLLAGGYLKAVNSTLDEEGNIEYTLELTNLEVMHMFRKKICDWFSSGALTLEYFLKALVSGNLREMNEYLNGIMLETLSCYDTGKAYSKAKRHENFYHGFVLGLLVSLRKQYVITSNRESGAGRYDVVMQARNHADCSFILEFKVFDPMEEKSLEDTVDAAIRQIVDKKYAADLGQREVPFGKIRIYGFAFSGKEALIGGGSILDYYSGNVSDGRLIKG